MCSSDLPESPDSASYEPLKLDWTKIRGKRPTFFLSRGLNLVALVPLHAGRMGSYQPMIKRGFAKHSADTACFGLLLLASFW